MDREEVVKALEHRCHALLNCADALLSRYKKPRRRPGLSPAAQSLGSAAAQVRGLKAFFDPEQWPRVLALEEELSRRRTLLNCRRIPLCSNLRRLRRLSRELALWTPEGFWSWPSVLVGGLRRPSQLEVCLAHGFYHLPAAALPQERLPVDFVAIYQSQTLFPENHGIRFYGRVKGCALVPRRQILEIPKQSDEWYYRLEIERWEQLEKPIEVREIPVIHLFTNLFLLLHSREVPELTLQTPEEYRRYQALRSVADSAAVFHHPAGKVRLKNGILQVFRSGRRLASFSLEAYSCTPGAVFRRIMDLLEQ